MTRRSDSIPDFVREAYEEESWDERDVSRSLELFLSDASLPAAEKERTERGRQRLLRAVEEAPLRYAPLFERVQQLCDLPEDRVEELLGRTDWVPSGLPGVKTIRFEGGPRRRDCELSLVRFASGGYFPRHTHHGLEQVFLLEGGYREHTGQDYLPGDLHEMTPGTTHSFRIHWGGPCIAVSILEQPFEFDSRLLRWLGRWARRSDRD